MPTGAAAVLAQHSPAAVLPAVLAAGAVLLWCIHPGRGRLSARGVVDRGRPRHARMATPGGAGPPSPHRRRGHDVRHVRVAGALAAAAAAWALVPGGWGVSAAGVAAAVTWRRSRGWEPAAVRRRRARVEAELPWLVDLLTTTLRAGLDPAEALVRAAEVSSEEVRAELQVPLARLRLGVDPVSVWSVLARDPELGRLGVCLRRATESGAPVADALTRLGADLRESRRAAVEVRVRRIEVKAAVPLGACLLPAFVLLAVVPLVAGSVSRLFGG